MKLSTINIENYEAFLLDRIEGNLSPQLTKELEFFMVENGLEDFEESDLVYLDEAEMNNPMSDICLFSEDMKRFEPSLSDEQMMFEAVEGTITDENHGKLKEWIAADPIIKRHYEAMSATRSLVDKDIIFPDKASLKKTAGINRPLYWLAAACLVGMLFTFGHQQLDNSDNKTPLVENTTISPDKNVGGEKAGKEIFSQNEGNNSLAPTAIAQGELANVEGQVKNSSATSVRSVSRPDLNQKAGNSIDRRVVNKNDSQPADQMNDQEMYTQISTNHSRSNIANLPKIARLGSGRVFSEQPVSAVVNTYHNKRNDNEPMMASAFNIKEKLDYLDRKSAAIYGFADFQKKIIKSEGLLELSKERNDEGRIEGYSLRIAGFELSTAK